MVRPQLCSLSGDAAKGGRAIVDRVPDVGVETQCVSLSVLDFAIDGKQQTSEKVNLADKLSDLWLGRCLGSESWPELASVRERKSKIRVAAGVVYGNLFAFADPCKCAGFASRMACYVRVWRLLQVPPINMCRLYPSSVGTTRISHGFWTLVRGPWLGTVMHYVCSLACVGAVVCVL